MKKFARWLFLRYYHKEVNTLNFQKDSRVTPYSVRVGIIEALIALDLLEG